MKSAMVSIGKIKPYKNNPRSNEATIEAVKRSISKYGFNVPIVLDKKGVIVCGHARYQAALLLKLATVPCITVDLTREQAKKYRLADNRIQELSVWDDRMMMVELREFSSFGDIPGFTSSDAVMYNSLFSYSDPSVGKEREGSTKSGDNQSPLRRSVGVKQKSSGVVTQQQVEADVNRANIKFESRDIKYQEGLVTIKCSGCGEDFTILKADLVRM